MVTAKKKTTFNLERTSATIDEQVGKLVQEAARNAALPKDTQQHAFIHSYCLIDMGYTANQPFQPNSIQFFSATDYLCSKVVDNASLTSLAPILNCSQIWVMWNTDTQEAVAVAGYGP